jgi:hypothetical protein
MKDGVTYLDHKAPIMMVECSTSLGAGHAIQGNKKCKQNFIGKTFEH